MALFVFKWGKLWVNFTPISGVMGHPTCSWFFGLILGVFLIVSFPLFEN